MAVKLSCFEMPIRAPLLWGILTSKVGRTNRVFGLGSEFTIVGMCMQDYKFLCVALRIYATLVNIQNTHIQHLTSLYDKLRPTELTTINKWLMSGLTKH